MKDKKHNQENPTVAPGMIINDPVEEKATKQEIKKGESTEVTTLFVDRTPED